MQTIGERIRHLRKEKKLTLQQLAGDRLTKGMLSLIENGKAQPSMDSLRFIAQQLEVEVSTLVQKQSSVDIRSVLQQVELLIHAHQAAYKIDAERQLRHEIIDFIQPYIDKLTFQRFEEIRLLQTYASYISVEDGPQAEGLFQEAITQYKRIGAWSYVAKCYTNIAKISFAKQLYEQCYQQAKLALHIVEEHEHEVDTMRKMDVYYFLIITAAAIGLEEDIERYFTLAQQLSKKEKVYYRNNEMHVLKFIQALQDDTQQAGYYLEKINQYAQYTEDPENIAIGELLTLQYMSLVLEDYEGVLQKVQALQVVEVPYLGEVIEAWLVAEAGVAYYHLGDYEQALQHLSDFHVSDYTPHPYDLSYSYYVFAIKGLVYAQLGNLEQAKKEILYAQDSTKPFPKNIYKTKIEDAYAQIFSVNS